MKVNGKNVLVEDSKPVYKVSELVWDTETLAGKNNIVNVNGTTKSNNLESTCIMSDNRGEVIGNMMFVAVGSNGTLTVSDTGTDFIKNNTNDNNHWYSICYGNGKFVAVGLNGACAFSDDGTNFTPVTVEVGGGAIDVLYSICYGNGKFVAVGNNSTLVCSNNGTDFNLISTGGPSYRSICYGNGKFVTVGDNGALMHSENVINNTKTTIDGNNTWRSICYGNGIMVH